MKRRIFEVRAWPGQGRSRVDREYPQVRGNHIVLGNASAAEQEVTGVRVVDRVMGRVMGRVAVHQTKRSRVWCPVQRKSTRQRFRPVGSRSVREQASRGGKNS